MGLVGQRHARPLYPWERPGTHYRRLGGPQGRSGRVRNMSSPMGFDPRTVQPVASRYIDRTIPALPNEMSTVGKWGVRKALQAAVESLY